MHIDYFFDRKYYHDLDFAKQRENMKVVFLTAWLNNLIK